MMFVFESIRRLFPLITSRLPKKKQRVKERVKPLNLLKDTKLSSGTKMTKELSNYHNLSKKTRQCDVSVSPKSNTFKISNEPKAYQKRKSIFIHQQKCKLSRKKKRISSFPSKTNQSIGVMDVVLLKNELEKKTP